MIADKPLVSQRLRKFKHFGNYVGRFIVRTVYSIELQLERRHAITQVGLLLRKHCGIDFAVDAHVDQAVLLTDDQRQLQLKLASLRQRVLLLIAGLRCEYSRAQAYDDGVLIDVSRLAQEAGIRRLAIQARRASE